MVEDAIRSLRALFVSTIAILLVWTWSLPSVLEKFAIDAALRDVHAWISLKQGLPPVSDVDVFGEPYDTTISSVLVEIPPAGPQDSGGVAPVPIQVTTTWPTVGQYEIELVPELDVWNTDALLVEQARIYRVSVRNAESALQVVCSFLISKRPEQWSWPPR